MEKKLRYLRAERPGVQFFYAPCAIVRGPHTIAPGQGADGYGRKISTDYVARYGGRTRRGYCCCFSNAGTCYVLERGEWLVVDDIPGRDALPVLPPEYRGGVTCRQ